ncbi:MULTISPECIES: HNH endonuclease [Pectobacterium]|uniref:HNH endonuclease n=1 Tax=Pectobacterium aquaticum TaxID=2204145 RepID=A0A426JE40_9GAMM|nr:MULTISPECIES: HNH endonuclease signature motif containing protein [Pectobacterium]MBN3238279.1 HNH endonuclease [Pectobacterium versatile]MBQ4778173.1 hypothetical protein [Pectobacterium versatile]PVY71171.1 hypothetical protein C7330_0127 [Pectobacterium versatile]RRO11420.1 HNH endonuclease [Pectobacterium aquaticum]
MKIKKPSDIIFVGDVTQRKLLEEVCSKRSSSLKIFFQKNKTAFLNDNDRFYRDFNNYNFYNSSETSYVSVKNSLNNLYKSAADDNERKYIKDFRKQHRQLLCPYCLRSTCRTLDHYFDKAKYSELSLNLWNLVPTCGDCNFKKLSTKISSGVERFIHPYFDDFYDKNESYHLNLIINTTSNAILVNFDFTANPGLPDQSMQSVINWHIKTLEVSIDNADMFRKDLEYFVNKIRTKGFTDRSDILDFITEELSYERGFSWRGVILHSLCHSQQNFENLLLLVFNNKYVYSE